MKIPKAVIDTNVFISAAFLKGASFALMKKWEENKFIFLFSAEIFDEYFEVISRPKFGQKEKDIREFSEIFTERAVAVEPQIKLDIVKWDPTDNKFLECAVSGNADFIVSGDQDLLVLKKYKSIKILKLVDFLHELE